MRRDVYLNAVMAFLLATFLIATVLYIVTR